MEIPLFRRKCVNWIPSIAMLMMSMAIADMAILTILAMMATIQMANVYFSMAKRGFQLKGIKKLAQ